MDAEGIGRQILREAGSKIGSNGYPTFYDAAMGFFHAVDWKAERWLQGVLAGHLLLWVLVLLGRKNLALQTAVFFCACALLFVAETLNSWCAAHWREFSTQNYFDKNGVFAGVVYAGPLILLLVFQVLNFVYMTSHMLVKVKRVELKVDQRSKQQGNTKKNNKRKND